MFRSVLPHEPVPIERRGYLQIQGSFEPHTAKKNDIADSTSDNVEVKHYWKKSTLEQALRQSPVQAVEVIDNKAPFTKVRLVLDSPHGARLLLAKFKREKMTPADLLHVSSEDAPLLDFSTRLLQVTQVTTCDVLSSDVSWQRSTPPKFRRFVARPGEDFRLLEKERNDTRFVFLTNLVHGEDVPLWWNDSIAVADAIRVVINAYDSSGLGVEVFVPNKQTIRSCYLGMRSPSDVKLLIKDLQDKQVNWRLAANDEKTNGEECCIQSGNLFLDFVGVTRRSYARAKTQGDRGEPTRSECTSETSSVVVPGLVLIPDFVSGAEEEVLVAVLTGPHAPWAPPQRKPTFGGTVKRRVQHYGYVFDYETANVLRDRSQEGADCPALPALSCSTGNVEESIERSVIEGRGWEALAGVVERTRQHNFGPAVSQQAEENSNDVRFSELNQLTVNEYTEGSGIGSHADTPSAFGDGLISISLNSGVVMEFRRTQQDATQDGESPPPRKLVYLPRRSLLLMSGPARYSWEHMIVSRMTDTHEGQVIPRGKRVSLTLRTALDEPSKGGMPLPRVETTIFPPTWGYHEGGQSPTVNGTQDEVALATPSTERNHVHAVYDAIATQWHHTRGKRGVLWPGATQFLTQLPPGSVVADVGCGDGKYFPAIWEAGSYVIGTDISLPLLKTSIGASAGFDVPDSRKVSGIRNHFRDRPAVAVADCMNVPLRSKSCDAAICIAVMHHLSTEARRLRCIEELVRIVRPGGTINIQAWAMEQDSDSRRKFAATDVFVPFNANPKWLDKKPPMNGTSRTVESGQSVAEIYLNAYEGAEFDERKGLVVFKRYCHLYRLGELEEIVSRVKGVEILESGYESGNHFLILKR